MFEQKTKERTAVLAQAFEGQVRTLAVCFGVSDKRLYQMISVNDPYRRLWELLTPLGQRAPSRLALVRADFNAKCDQILFPNQASSTPATVFDSCRKAFQAILEKHPKWKRSKEIREAIAELQKELAKCEE